MAKAFFVDLTRCTGCRGCHIACKQWKNLPCPFYTSDAADDLLCVDLGGGRIIKKKKTSNLLAIFTAQP